MITRFIFILALTVLSANATEYIKWFHTYESGHKEALKLEKPIMLFLKDDSSEESKKMFVKTFSNKEVIRLVNKNFVSIQLPKGTDQFPLELYYTLEFPTLFFATRYEVLYGDIFTGYIDSKKLSNLIKRFEGTK